MNEMQFDSFFCQRYKCKMSEQSCKRYQMQEYGQACSGCEQMNVPKINFVQEAGNHFYYIKICAYCGTQDRTKFKKGFNRICEECRDGKNLVVHGFNPSMKPRNGGRRSEHGIVRGTKIVVECPDCHRTREIVFNKTIQLSGLVRCQTCAKKDSTVRCKNCNRWTRIHPSDEARFKLQYCVQCMRG